MFTHGPPTTKFLVSRNPIIAIFIVLLTSFTAGILIAGDIVRLDHDRWDVDKKMVGSRVRPINICFPAFSPIHWLFVHPTSIRKGQDLTGFLICGLRVQLQLSGLTVRPLNFN